MIRFLEYLDYDVAMEIFAANDIFYLKPLFTGPMNEALNYDLKFDSTIPKIYGLPALPKGKSHFCFTFIIIIRAFPSYCDFCS